jgi:WhiB family redox-sensing transcriptional regulator
VHDPDLWFAEAPADLELAKALCARCPARLVCLTGAVDRREAAGVWGGEIFDHGQVVTHKRPRGRPRKDSTPPQRYPAPLAERLLAHLAPRCVDEDIDEIAIERAVSSRHPVRLHDLAPAEQDKAVGRLTERGKSIRDIAEHRGRHPSPAIARAPTEALWRAMLVGTKNDQTDVLVVLRVPGGTDG